MRPPTKLPKELDLTTAFELTRKLVVTSDQEPRRPGLMDEIRYWLWRIGGRRRPGIGESRQLARLAEKYERDLAHQRQRVAELERLTGQLQRAFEAELAKVHAGHAQDRTEWEAKRVNAAALADAEARARLAENKVEMLKEALELTRARAGTGTGEPSAGDTRFRDAKRAFARAFHPDQGGRDDAEKQRMFLEFWPELERIEREG